MDGTSLTFTRIKSECPAQAQMGGREVRGFQMTGALTTSYLHVT